MAIEIRVRKPAQPVVATQVVPPPLTARLNLTLRRRRMRRLQQALVTAAWVGGGSLLLFFVALGVLSLH